MTPCTMLAGDLLVPDDAMRLAWSLEDRGFTFRLEGEKLVLSGPIASLTAEDRSALTHWKPSLLAIVAYQGPAL